MYKSSFLLLMGIFLTLATWGQSREDIHIKRATSAITVDGHLNERDWHHADSVRNFYLNFPSDTGFSQYPTTVRLAFDDNNLYLAAHCIQEQNAYTVQSLKRDYPNGSSDGINLVLDPFRDGLNGFFFGVSPLNVQREALVDNGENLSYDWDNKWTSAVVNAPGYWTVEMAIPFKTLRYAVGEGQNSWNINVVRTRLQPWDVSALFPVPRQFRPFSLAFARALVWETPPPQPGINISVIPYVNTNAAVTYFRKTDLTPDGATADFDYGVGGDVKIALTPSLNLDLTVNPDFSQVEVDRQVPNLSRFELFFPERRQFFLENRDLFAMFGFPSTRPFFSRRIGLARNPKTGINTTVPILAGARLSGKINQKWRIGGISMQTRSQRWDETASLPAANYSVLTLQRKVFDRSTIGGIFTNKFNFSQRPDTTEQQPTPNWNRVAGLEYNLYSKDNRWEGEWYWHRSMSPDPKKRGNSAASFIGYNDRNIEARLGYLYVDSNFTADAGFVNRVGIQNVYPALKGRIFPTNGGKINSWGAGVEGDLTFSLTGQPTDRDLYYYGEIELTNQSGINIGYFRSYTYLFQPFDPTNLYNIGTLPLPPNRGYAYQGMRGEIFSSSTYDLQGRTAFSSGSFFNGSLTNIAASLAYRWQPVGIFTLNMDYNQIRLPQPYPSTTFWLIGPRAELSFSRNLFASVFLQYNTQTNNFNINSRLQWRFAPVSDLFLVYTDNSYAYSIEGTPVQFASPKNKALVLKAVVWLNL
jgi:hypothetical protein